MKGYPESPLSDQNKMNKLQNYFEVEKNVITTTDVIKTSFKIAFDMLDKEDFVIMENKRRNDKLVLLNLKEYAILMKKLEDAQEALFDLQVTKVIDDDKSPLVEI